MVKTWDRLGEISNWYRVPETDGQLRRFVPPANGVMLRRSEEGASGSEAIQTLTPPSVTFDWPDPLKNEPR